ncbi:hypothetical protein EV182_001948, partial [Spiromyces aspiralis]
MLALDDTEPAHATGKPAVRKHREGACSPTRARAALVPVIQGGREPADGALEGLRHLAASRPLEYVEQAVDPEPYAVVGVVVVEVAAVAVQLPVEALDGLATAQEQGEPFKRAPIPHGPAKLEPFADAEEMRVNVVRQAGSPHVECLHQDEERAGVVGQLEPQRMQQEELVLEDIQHGGSGHHVR